MNLCIGLLSYWVMYWHGPYQYHFAEVTRTDRTRIEALLKDKKFRADFDVYQVNHLKFKPFKKPRNCK